MNVEPVKRPLRGLPPMPAPLLVVLSIEAGLALGVLGYALWSPAADSGDFWFGALLFSFFCFTWLVSRMTRTIEVLERMVTTERIIAEQERQRRKTAETAMYGRGPGAAS